MSNDEPTPGPGWWMASDGKLYPPEEHPDAIAGAKMPTSPPIGGNAPTPAAPAPAPGGTPGLPISTRGLVGGLMGGLLGAAAVVALVGALIAGYFMFIALPSPAADRELLESVLPGDEDVPPGLIPGDRLDDAANDSGGSSSSSDSTGDCTSGVSTRASADVSYYESAGNFGEKGFLLSATSYESADDAATEVDSVDQAFVDRCFGSDFVAANTTTGGADGATSSVVVIVEGIGGRAYMVMAQKDRFVVLSVAIDADRALELASETLAKL